jgi:hypothetical protein
MLGNKLSSIINAKLRTDIDILENSSSPKYKEDQAKLERLKKVISKIKENLTLLSDNQMTIKLDKNKNIFITNTSGIFDTNIVASDTYSDSRKNVDFFDFYKKSNFNKTINDFKLWLEENNIKSIIIEFTHCGGGIDSWNNYYAELKKGLI